MLVSLVLQVNFSQKYFYKQLYSKKKLYDWAQQLTLNINMRFYDYLIVISFCHASFLISDTLLYNNSNKLLTIVVVGSVHELCVPHLGWLVSKPTGGSKLQKHGLFWAVVWNRYVINTTYLFWNKPVYYR